MIERDFVINFQNRRIAYNHQGSGNIYTINELYSFLQETFSKPQYMNYDIPIEAGSKTKYSLAGGWVMDEEALKHLRGGNLVLEVRNLNGIKFKELNEYLKTS